MEPEQFIVAEEFCASHKIEFSFIDTLQEFGLIDIIIIEDNKYLANEKIKEVEKMMRLHFELDINMEGIDAISNLLQQIDNLQQELLNVKNKLKLYEND